MKLEIADLQHLMTAAAEAQEFEGARQLRDQINLMCGGASVEAAARADSSCLSRQKSGAMGIGTNKSKPVVPKGWQAPKSRIR